MLVKVINKLLGVSALVMALSLPLTAHAKVIYDVPNNSEFKAYMDYRTITSVNSTQYKIQQKCITDSNGVRCCNGRYTVAIGTGFKASAGTYIDVKLSSGKVLKCIVGDIKQDIHTDSTNMQVSGNGNVVEFIVDSNILPKTVKNQGTLSALDEFSGYVDTITTYSKEDMESVKWEQESVDLSSTSERLVLNKYTINVADNDLYIVEYESDNDYNTLEVDVETFNSLIINESYITIK